MEEVMNGDEITISSSEQSFKTTMAAGTAEIQRSVDRESFSAIKNGTFAADDDGILDLSDCRLKFVLTGDARFWIGEKNKN